MVLGAVSCPLDKAREVSERVREIKAHNHVSPTMEVKWSKVSAGQSAFYHDLIDCFFDDDHLRFRVLIADKSKLRHADFRHDHDTWYYKMYFLMLKTIFVPDTSYRIYLDIKDTRSQAKVRKLHEILCHNIYDFDRKIIERVQQIRSHEVESLQLADLLIGAVCYANRALSTNAGKASLVARIRKRSGYELSRSTLPSERKFNLFHWRGQESAL